MLVLSRKAGQRIQIADNITVTVLEIKGSVVKLGIEAPADVRILRGELPQWLPRLHEHEPHLELAHVG